MGALLPGEVLSLSDGSEAIVTGMSWEFAPEGERFTTYNFEVEDYHTYFVRGAEKGSAWVWVHNNDDPGPGGSGCGSLALRNRALAQFSQFLRGDAVGQELLAGLGHGGRRFGLIGSFVDGIKRGQGKGFRSFDPESFDLDIFVIGGSRLPGRKMSLKGATNRIRETGDDVFAGLQRDGITVVRYRDLDALRAKAFGRGGSILDIRGRQIIAPPPGSAHLEAMSPADLEALSRADPALVDPSLIGAMLGGG